MKRKHRIVVDVVFGRPITNKAAKSITKEAILSHLSWFEESAVGVSEVSVTHLTDVRAEEKTQRSLRKRNK